MSEVLDQFGLDHTFFIQFAIFAGLFFVLAPLYFKPFQKLFDVRHQKLVKDKTAAEGLVATADQKLKEYQLKIAEAQRSATTEFEKMVTAARKEESEILSRAREEARKITLATNENVIQQSEMLKAQLQKEIEGLALQVSEKVLSRKV